MRYPVQLMGSSCQDMSRSFERSAYIFILLIRIGIVFKRRVLICEQFCRSGSSANLCKIPRLVSMKRKLRWKKPARIRTSRECCLLRIWRFPEYAEIQGKSRTSTRSAARLFWRRLLKWLSYHEKLWRRNAIMQSWPIVITTRRNSWGVCKDRNAILEIS